ncbi:LysM domain receptor kinase 4 [Spatholobus suberectus]|nr:LysM domain receptor kinase 4 [Spatholobus suberectus]
MNLFPITPIFTLIILCGISVVVQGQQPYIGLATTACHQTGNSNSMRGYTCNGVTPSCQAYLTFRAQPLYNSVPLISALLGSDASQLSEANSVSEDATFETNKLVIVPINCSCSGNQYYQFNTSYVVQKGDSYFLIANNTFEGLSTCQALQDQNNIPEGELMPGAKLKVPLRCACPSKNQTEEGVKYLLSYLVASNDIAYLIGKRFGVSTDTIVEANNLSSQQPAIYPFTTLLVPLQDKPKSNQTFEPSPPPPPPPPPSSSSGSSSKTWVYAVVGAVGGVALILILCAIIFRTRYLKDNKKKDDSVIVSDSFVAVAIEKPQGKKMEGELENLEEIISGIGKSFKMYRFKELQSATNDFGPSSCIKGSVYRGVINGDLAAIKKIDGDVSKEIELLTKVNHSNVIRLSGAGFNEGYWYLVYEYAANGNLSDWIYINGKFLSWTQRMQITLDVATGLDYLHSFTSPPHVHKDLKSGNILLDSAFRAKIANFGLARSVEREGEGEQYVMTRHIVGTRGYMAPEYLENGLVSRKLDVYAFGILMLEMLTGKEVADIYAQGNNMNLLDALSAVLDEEGQHERLKEFMDPSLQENYPTELAVFVARMIGTCLKKDPASRPDMHEIVSSMSKALDSSLRRETSMERKF